MSGHSKWSQIKRQKGANDAKRGALFTKLTREIITAARQGGGDVDGNYRLRMAVDKARASSMPQENIKRAVERATGAGADGEQYEEITYEGLGPANVAVIVQVMLLDIVFSLDSVITAVGMADYVSIMIAAIVIAVFTMLFASTSIADFVERHPTVKMLALSFLLLIGLSLIAEGLGQHVPKGYIYFAMGFSVFVEMINLRVRSKGHAVHLRRNLPDQ